MSNGDINKIPKFQTQSTTDPETSTSGIGREDVDNPVTPPLLAKDSEWVGSEDGPYANPLDLMFPALLERDPKTMEGILNKKMSTTEVTKHLVDLGQKANFNLMKKVHRLIPRDKKWLESLSENSQSYSTSDSESKLSTVSSERKTPNSSKANLTISEQDGDF